VPKYFFNVYRSREPPRIDKERQRFADDQSALLPNRHGSEG